MAAQNVSALEDHLRDAELFKKAGVSTNYDVLRVEVQVSEARSDLLDATDNIVVAKQALAEALGKPAEDRDLAGDLPVLKPEVLKAISGGPVGTDDRLDIQSLRARVGARSRQARGRRRLLPGAQGLPLRGLPALQQYQRPRRPRERGLP